MADARPRSGEQGGALANYFVALRKELVDLSHACGEVHPALVSLDRWEILDNHLASRAAREAFHYEAEWGLPSPADCERIGAIMTGGSTEHSGPDPDRALAGHTG